MATQILPEISTGPTESVRQERELKAALLRVVAPLKCRPYPPHRWNNLAAEGSKMPSITAAVEMCQQAQRAAARDPEKLARVRVAVDYLWSLGRSMSLDGVVPALEPAGRVAVRAEEQVLEAIAVLENCSKLLMTEINRK